MGTKLSHNLFSCRSFFKTSSLGTKLLSLCAALLLSCQLTTEVVPNTVSGIKVDSVFKIWVSKDGLSGYNGSAVAYKIIPRQDMKYELYLLTACHTVSFEDVNTYKIISTMDLGLSVLELGSPSYDFVVVSKNPDLDVSVIKAVVPRYFPVSELYTGSLRTGQRVAAVGYPINLGTVITDGYVCFAHLNTVAVSCNAFFGSSGGAVFDTSSGKIMGILVSIATYRNSTGGFGVLSFISYTAPTSLIKPWLEKEGLT